MTNRVEELAPDAAIVLADRTAPAVFRGIAADWPAVKAADPGAYLAQFDTGKPIGVAIAPPEANGRLGYNADMSALTFVRDSGTLASLFARLHTAAPASTPPAIAAQAVAVPEALPGFEAENRMPLAPEGVAPRIWIGNRVRVATHHDMNSNIAVVMAGRRRFTLFPPDQVANLYIGPIEFTPAGTPIGLFDPDEPDFDRFPLAREAMARARIVELEPGDAVFIPHMWWHHVRSLDPVSILVNYWWDEAPAPQPGLAPLDTMVHAILAFSGLPENQRAAWRAMFDEFVFGPPLDHVPEERRGIRGTLSEDSKARVRRQLGQMMSR
jgi:mannose-6-phosphate isomerase-like protein (cupin superfamily)